MGGHHLYSAPMSHDVSGMTWVAMVSGSERHVAARTET